MAITHTWTTVCKPSTLASMPAGVAAIITGSFANDIEEVVPAGALKQVFAGAIDHLVLVSFNMHTDKQNVTINTNSETGSGGQTFDLGLAKNEGWFQGMTASGVLVTNPVTTDITEIWVDNSAGAVDTVFRASFLTLLA